MIDSPAGTSVTHPELLARDHSAFAMRVIPSTGQAAPGVTVTTEAVDLGDGRFTNLYELKASSRTAEIELWSARGGSYLPDLLDTPAVIATVTGSFSFISDDPEYFPAEPCFDLCVRAGAIASLPTSDKPALLTQGRVTGIRWIRAQGRLIVGDRLLRWIGAQSAAGRAGPAQETVEVFGAANCRVRYLAAERTGFRRYVSRPDNRTPPDAAAVDVVVVRDEQQFTVTEVHPGGGADLFAGAFVLRFWGSLPAEVGPGCPVRISEIDGLDSRSITAAWSVGPSVADAARGSVTGYGDFLGNAPFAAAGCHARTLVSISSDGEITLQVLDGAPLTRWFRGPTPAEVREIVSMRGMDPSHVFHLDGGGSAKMAFHGDRAPIVVGGLYYLRWPTKPAEAFEWRGLKGRRLHSAIRIRWPDPGRG